MPTVPGHIERICDHAGILRLGGAYGDPWTWTCTVRFDSPTSVTVMGAPVAPTSDEWRAAIAVGRAEGITAFRFVRRSPDGGLETHVGRMDE